MRNPDLRYPASFWNGAAILCGAVFLVQLIFVDGLSWPGSSLPLNYPWTGLAFLALALLGRHQARCRREFSDSRDGASVFLLSLFLFLSTFRWHGSDDLPTSVLPFCILRHGTLRLDSMIAGWSSDQMCTVLPAKGHWVSFYPIIGSLLSLPVYMIPAWRGAAVSDHVLHQLSKISAALICAAAVLALFNILRRSLTARQARAGALVYALGTNIFSLASQGLWQYGPSCLMIILALGLAQRARDDRRYWLGCGFFAVLCVSARTPNAIHAAAFLVLAFWGGGWPGLGYFAAGAALPALALEAYWWGAVGTGLPAEFGLSGLFSFPPRAAAAAALLISPGRGILLYSPVTLFLLWGWARCLRAGPAALRREAAALGASVLASFIFFSCFLCWDGGFSFGPRYLMEDLTVLFYFFPAVVAGIETYPNVRRYWRLACAASILCHAAGAYGTWRWEDLAKRTSFWNPAVHPVAYTVRYLLQAGPRRDQ